jgi:hypothetical protein
MVGATALASIPIVVLVETASSPSVRSLAGFGATMRVASSQTAQVLTTSCPARDGTTLTIHLHQTDLIDGSLIADLSVCMGTSVARQVLQESGEVGSGVPTLSVSGFGSTLAARLVPVADTQLRLANQDASTGGTSEPIGAVTLPLQGDPRLYPIDRYASEINPFFSDTCTVGVIDPLKVDVIADPGVGGFNWSVAETNGNTVPAISETASRVHGVIRTRINCGGGGGTTLALAARRPATTRLFVLSLVAIPLLLIGLLGVRLSGGTPRSVDGLLGVTAIMLAILPIREVLVPTDISSLTLVDFALASEMALLATGTVWWFVWPRRTRRVS